MSSSDIPIEDVNLKMDERNRYTEGKVQILITLNNKSKTSTYYVPKRPRNFEYDPGLQTLYIDLYEKELPQDIKVGYTPFEPEQVAVLPNTPLQSRYLLSVRIKKNKASSRSKEVLAALSKWGEPPSASFETTLISRRSP
jgi:hypothetical protein